MMFQPDWAERSGPGQGNSTGTGDVLVAHSAKGCGCVAGVRFRFAGFR